MTFSAKHATEAVGSYPDDGELGPDDWNNEHVLTMSASFLLGRTSPGDGPVEEIPCSDAGFAMLAAADVPAQKALLSLSWGDLGGTLSSQTDLQSALDGKAASSHNHDDRYYTDAEVDSLLSGKSAVGHNHDSRYYTETEVDSLLAGKAASSHTHTLSQITDAGTAAGYAIGTSGAKVPLLNGDNTHSGSLTLTGQVTVDQTNNYFVQEAAAGISKYIRFTAGGLRRWDAGVTSEAESGANAGANYLIRSADDAGNYKEDCLKVFRATGKTWVKGLTVNDTPRAKINSGANEGVIIARHWCALTGDYTLSNSGSAQKFFNTTATGALTLPTGVYEFEWLAYVTGMSGTSGNASFGVRGGGTAALDRYGYVSTGLDNSTPTTAAAVSGAVSVSATVPAAAAGTGTGLQVMIRGTFRVTSAGTIIPSITLTTAIAAVAKAGSYFKCAKIGETTESYVGAWS